MGIRCSYTAGKAAAAWSWPLTSILCTYLHAKSFQRGYNHFLPHGYKSSICDHALILFDAKQTLQMVRCVKYPMQRICKRPICTCSACACFLHAVIWCTAPLFVSSVCDKASPWRSFGPSLSSEVPVTLDSCWQWMALHPLDWAVNSAHWTGLCRCCKKVPAATPFSGHTAEKSESVITIHYITNQP